MKVTPVKKFGKYRVGEEFEMPEKAARPFIKAGRIMAVENKILGVTAGTDEGFGDEPDISPRTGKPKRTYRRRDMQAE
jgi:hypothetical protein